MARVLVRGLKKQVLERLKKRARNHRRSLQAELKVILERAAAADIAEARDLARKIRRMLAGRRIAMRRGSSPRIAVVDKFVNALSSSPFADEVMDVGNLMWSST
jgi:plasmid stability protein